MTFPKPSEAHSTIATHDKPDKSQFRRRRSIPSTIAEEEGQHMDHSPRPPRRSNSVRTTESSSLESRRASFRSSTDSLFMPPRPEGVHDELHEEPSLWYSAPLLFAIVPAVGGVAFKKGTVLLTDFALLSLAAVYLNWCLITPWIWYHSARKVNIAEPPLQGPISEETLEEDLHQDVHDDTPEHGVLSEGENPGKDWMASQDTSKESNVREASAELQLHELAALATCVLGPLLGSYILHLIRSSLSSLHGGQLVSNLHLTLFVLGAELRPIRHCIKLIQARTLYLQRLVRTDPHVPIDREPDSDVVVDIASRVDNLEASLAEAVISRDEAQSKAKAEPSATPEDVKKVQHALQAQIDALNRAVRRYEKRMTAQTVQTEARLQDLETRLKDALSLAAAAATYSQKPGFFASMLQRFVGAIRSIIDILTLPVRFLSDMGWKVLKRMGLARPLRRKRLQERQRWSETGKINKERPALRNSKAA